MRRVAISLSPVSNGSYTGLIAGAAAAAAAGAAAERGSEDSSGDGSHQASTGSPTELPLAQTSSPHALSCTGPPAIAVGSVQGEAARTSGREALQEMVPSTANLDVGNCASLALDSLRKVAAGQRSGRLGITRTSADAAHVDGKPLHAIEAAASDAVGLTSATASATEHDTGLIAVNEEASQAALVGTSPHAVESNSGSVAEAAQSPPMAPMQPATAPVSALSGNPLASPMSEVRRVATGETPQLGSPQGAGSLAEHTIETAGAGLSVHSGAPRRMNCALVAPADSPAVSSPATKRGRFTEQSLARAVSAEQLAEAAIQAATAALVRTAAPRPPRPMVAGACLSLKPSTSELQRVV